jgi:hypothetical protein
MNHQLLKNLDLAPRRPVEEYLQDVTVTPLSLQDFTPLTRSLEWELSEQSWSGAGIRNFASVGSPSSSTITAAAPHRPGK